MKVFMGTHFADGIKRVVDALRQGLPDYGIDVIDDPRQADILAIHGADHIPRHDLPIIAHTHGLMWDDYTWGSAETAQTVNKRIISVMTCADAITAPSRWVAHAISRGMLRTVIPIHHGIDADAWECSGEHDGYVLWNKARIDIVSDPRPVNRVASLLPGTSFVTTFGRQAPNVRIIGPQSYAAMRPIVQRAGVYLATTRETFGIGTLEALAAGVPVVGYRYGGQEEIIRDGDTGYLVEPGDDDGLAAAVERALRDRARLSRNAVADVRTRWQWKPRLEQYRDCYLSVGNDRRGRPDVSVVITCHNLERYLDTCLASVLAQRGPSVEVVLVDDCSDPWVMPREGARLERTPYNLGLSGARNYGASFATGRYLLFLDADDMLAADALARQVAALDAYPDLHIAYGSLQLLNDDGSEREISRWPDAYDWREQMAHLNQLHYAALMRRSVWAETGGYRERDWRAEDAAFWCRATSFGFRAGKVTEAPTLLYRIRPDSKGQQERQAYADLDGDWTRDFPWATAHSGDEGVRKRRNGQIEPPIHLVPFGAQGEPRPPRTAWPVWHHQAPAVSVIIPCGPGHEGYLIDALDSLVAQDIPSWEAIVINDTGAPWTTVTGAPYAQVLHTTGRQGPGAARNVGLAAARAPLALFLDADDWLVPGALRALLDRYSQGDAGYVYGDWLAHTSPHAEHLQESGTYSQDAQFARFLHPVTVLMPTAYARVLGFDETIHGWEDWDFFLRCAVAGQCGVRIPVPTIGYRLSSGTMRTRSQAEADAIKAELKRRYGAYATGAKPMAGCCGGNARAVLAAQQAVIVPQLMGPEPPSVPAAGNVILRFIGPQTAPITYHVNGRTYKGARSALYQYIEVPAEDAAKLVLRDLEWQVVQPPPEVPKEAQVSSDPPTPEREPEAVVEIEAVPVVARARPGRRRKT